MEESGINRYLDEIGRESLLSADEERQLAQKIKSGDSRALNKLVEANLRFVVKIASQYKGRGLALDDLVSEGNMGLMKAASRFDADRGTRFVNYAVVHIRQQIEKAIARGEIARHVCNRHGDFFRVLIPNTPEDNASFVTFSFHSYYCHNTDAEDITRQILEQHQLMKQFHAFLRKYVPGFENVRLTGLSSLPGARDS